MKKFICLILSIILLVSLVACKNKNDTSSNKNENTSITASNDTNTTNNQTSDSGSSNVNDTTSTETPSNTASTPTPSKPSKPQINAPAQNKPSDEQITPPTQSKPSEEIVDKITHIEISSKEDIYALSRILSTNYAKGNYYSKPSALSLKNDLNRFKFPSKLTKDDEKIEYLQTASYKLVNNIEVVLTKEYGSSAWDSNAFIGIGSSAYPFKGKFDGNNKTISLSSNKDLESCSITVDYLGLFSQVSDAEIINTKVLISSNITATNSSTGNNLFAMGGLVGYANNTKITNCSIDFINAEFGLDYSSKDVFDDMAHIGGLVGRSNRTVYNNCTVNLKNSKIYAIANNVSRPSDYAGISIGGVLGFSGAGSDNTTELGTLGNQLYNCKVSSNNSSQQDVILASIEGGTETTVGGLVGCAFNNFLAKNCIVNIKKGNISSVHTGDTASSNLGSAVGGIIGRMEHTGTIIKCTVTGDYLNISSVGPDNTHHVGGIAGNAYGPVHRDVTPILDCHFDGSGTSTLSVKVDTTNLKEEPHVVDIGGIAGYLTYQMYDCTVKDVLIINHSAGMKNISIAGELVGTFEKACHSNGNWTPGPIEIKRCTATGVTFNISSNVIKKSIG